MTPEERAELRRLAEAATPGEWAADGRDIYLGVTQWPDPDDDYNMTYWDSAHRIYDEGGHSEDDARWIAAANPAAILRLLDELDRLEKR